jgi:N6-L-threonylcarbamoyladenine synthase
MICLGIESTAHTFGIGIVDDQGKVLANVSSSYKPKLGKGIDPTEAKEHHLRVKEEVLKKALEQAKIEKPDLLSFSSGPGLPPCLIIGFEFIKSLAEKWDLKVVPVNHCIAHIEIGKLSSKAKDPAVLYLSGGNTQVIAFEGGKYRIFGETLDQPLGNIIDVFAREAGLPMPGGPEIEKIAKGRYAELPYSVKGMDVSFSGMLTNLKDKLKSGEYKVEDLAYSLQETAFAMLVEVSERAMAHTEKDELLLVGGVAANKRLQEMCKTMCNERGAEFYVVPKEHSGDNGVMIAWTGIISKDQAVSHEKLDINPKWRTDQVDISWR